MTERPRPHRRGSISRRLALWIALTTTVSLTVFGIVAYMVVIVEEREEAETGGREETAEDVRDEVLTAMASAAPIGLILAVAGAWWITRRSLSPIDSVIGQASTMTAAQLDRRIPVPRTDDELRAMVQTLNDLFERLEAGYSGLSRFTADASHELRTPLTVIATELEIALRNPRSVSEWESSAKITLDEVRRLTHLVELLLALARADTTVPIQGEPTDLVALVEQVLAAHHGSAEDSGVALPAVVEAPHRTTWVNADADALYSALSNLVSNAVRYSPSGGAVRVLIESRPHGRVALHVDDDGPGLTPEERETVFDPFIRGASTRRARGGSAEEGMGLGLAIARRIVENHAGAIRASAAPSGGARFTIELPLCEPPQPD